MPSLASNNSINCCIGREPPSPDGLSPRPAVSSGERPMIASNRVPKGQAPLTSLHIADPHPANLNDEESDPTPSKNVSTPSNDESDPLESNEPSGSDSVKPIKAKMSRSSLNLKAVTKNLKKHLSRESALSKRRSRSSVGQSEEEVERRAELRRIRQKRIQEELSSKEIYDDADSTSAVTNTPPGVNGQTLYVPGTPSRPPSLTLPQLSMSALSLPMLSPLARSVRKHTSALEHAESLISISTQPTSSSATKRSSVGVISRRHSSPLIEPSFADPRVYLPSRPLRKLGFVPPTPATPNTRPVTLPPLVAPEKSSWRLSFTSSNRGEQLRKLSKEHGVPSILSSDLLKATRPATRKWLHSQGLISSSQVLETSSDAEVSTSLEDTGNRQELGGVDGPEDSPSEALPDKANVSPAPVTDGPQDSDSILLQASPKLELSPCGAPDNRNISQLIHTSRPQTLKSISGSISLPERLSAFGEEKVVGGIPSTSISILQPTKTPRFSLISLISGKKGRIDAKEPFGMLFASPSQLKTESEVDAALVNKTLRVEDDAASSLTAPSTPYVRRSTIDGSSILASETESYREREAELKVVQARFASTDAHRIPTPRSSKFKEEFELDSSYNPLAEPRERKKSAFARLTRFATRNYDGATAMEDLLAVPMPKFSVKELQNRQPDHLAPLADDSDVSAQWETAIKLATDSKTKEVNNRSQFPAKNGSQGSRKGSTMSGMGWRRVDKGKKREDEPLSAAAQYEKRFQERLAVKEMVMDDWEAEIEASAQRAKARSRNIVRKTKASTDPDKRFPSSWSHFPSHTRGERCLSAGVPDQVEQHDFAIRMSDSGEQVFRQCRQAGERHIHDEDPDWREHDPEEMGLSARIGDKISQTLYQFEVRGGGSKPFEFQTGGSRGSMVLANKLAFPELHLLPVSPGMPKDDEAGQENLFEQEMATCQDKGKKSAVYGNGASSVDETQVVSLPEDLAINIADPGFYNDCLVFTALDRTETPFTEAAKGVSSVDSAGFKRSRSLTWHKQGSNGSKSGRGRNMSVGNMGLRASTDDYYDELARMEKMELEKLLQCTE